MLSLCSTGCTAQRKTSRSLLINDNCTIKRKTLLSACLRMMGSTTKTIFFSTKFAQNKTKFAQNKGKTLCSLLVFTQLFRTRNKERSIFAQFTQVSRSCTCAYLKKWPRYAPASVRLCWMLCPQSPTLQRHVHMFGHCNATSHVESSSYQCFTTKSDVDG